VAHGLLIGEPAHRLGELLATLEVDEADREQLPLVVEALTGDRTAAIDAESLVRVPGSRTSS